MATYDFGELRRQRQAADAGINNELTITDADGAVVVKYRLVAKLPAQFFDYGARGQVAAGFALIFEDPAEAKMFLDKYRPSFEDIGAIIGDLYPGLGSDLGKAWASGIRSTATDGTQ